MHILCSYIYYKTSKQKCTNYERQIYIVTATSDVTPAQLSTKTVLQSDQYNNEGNVIK